MLDIRDTEGEVEYMKAGIQHLDSSWDPGTRPVGGLDLLFD